MRRKGVDCIVEVMRSEVMKFLLDICCVIILEFILLITITLDFIQLRVT